MPVEHYLAADWGTSHLRLYLCAFDPLTHTTQILAEQNGAGIASIAKDHDGTFEDEFFRLADEWLAVYDIQQIILAGMVGSNIGWYPAAYSDCPASASSLARATVEFTARGRSLHIVGGVSCTNPLGEYDVMRGEELQLLAWLSQQEPDDQVRLFVLPGTHNKWALVQNGVIVTFMTTFTGELFNLLTQHSVLIARDVVNAQRDHTAYDQGVALSYTANDPDLVQTLFSTRSRQIAGLLSANSAREYLSGLIIGTDIRSALSLFARQAQLAEQALKEIVLIGEAQLCERYARVLAQYTNIACQHTEIQQIAANGFHAIYEQLRA